MTGIGNWLSNAKLWDDWVKRKATVAQIGGIRLLSGGFSCLLDLAKDLKFGDLCGGHVNITEDILFWEQNFLFPGFSARIRS